MQTRSTVCRWVMWILYPIVLFFQFSAIYGTLTGTAANSLEIRPTINLMMILTVLFFTAVTAFLILPLLYKGKRAAYLCALVTFITVAAMSVLFVPVALKLYNYFGGTYITTGGEVGLSLWDVIYRHMSPLLFPLLMIPVFLDLRELENNRKYAEEKEKIPSILGDLNDFHLSALPDEGHRPVREKRSVRQRRLKEEQNKKH